MTNRVLHEAADGMGLMDEYFAQLGLNPDAEVVCNCKWDGGHESNCDIVAANALRRSLAADGVRCPNCKSFSISRQARHKGDYEWCCNACCVEFSAASPRTGGGGAEQAGDDNATTRAGTKPLNSVINKQESGNES